MAEDPARKYEKRSKVKTVECRRCGRTVPAASNGLPDWHYTRQKPGGKVCRK